MQNRAMKILLVNPPVNRLCDVANNYFPLGLGYIAAITNGNGFETRIYNSDLEIRELPLATNRRRLENHDRFISALKDESHLVWLEFQEVLRNYMPTVVGFSCTSASILPCLKMAEYVKKISGATVVFGGMHPTILPEETAAAKNVDYVVAGDGEQSFLLLVKSLALGEEARNIPGVGSNFDGKFCFTPALPVEHKIDTFPLPDRDSIVNYGVHKNYLQAMLTSRGCPFKCTFCSGRNITKEIVRYRSPESVVDEMRLLKEKYGMNHIAFYDDSFVLNKKRLEQLCRLIIKNRLNVTWGGFTRADSVDSELLAVMKESGCTYLGIGVESGSDVVLEKIKKGYTRDEAIKGVNLVKNAGIQTSINVIVGFPFETEQNIKDTISLIKELNVSTNINTFTPYPKSELYDECVARGLIRGGMDWAAFSQHSLHNKFIQEVDSKTYGKLLDEMVGISDDLLMKNCAANVRWAGHRIIADIWRESEHSVLGFCKIFLRKSAGRLAGTLKGREGV